MYQIEDKFVFKGYEEFIKVDKIADVVILTTLDNQHYIPRLMLLTRAII